MCVSAENINEEASSKRSELINESREHVYMMCSDCTLIIILFEKLLKAFLIRSI